MVNILIFAANIALFSALTNCRMAKRGAWGVKFIRPIRAIHRQTWPNSPTTIFDAYQPPIDLYHQIPGCIRMSYNSGCLRCKPRMFMHFQRIGSQQVAVCHHTCPAGYYKARMLHNINRCLRCKLNNCLSCYTSDYCTKCRLGHFLYKGKCVSYCPAGFHSNIINQQCQLHVDCVVSDWSSWGGCKVRSNSNGSCRKSKKKRTRMILQSPSQEGEQCPKLKQRKLCRFSLPKCLLKQKKSRRKSHDNRKKRIGNNTQKTDYDIIHKNSIL